MNRDDDSELSDGGKADWSEDELEVWIDNDDDDDDNTRSPRARSPKGGSGRGDGPGRRRERSEERRPRRKDSSRRRSRDISPDRGNPTRKGNGRGDSLDRSRDRSEERRPRRNNSSEASRSRSRDKSQGRDKVKSRRRRKGKKGKAAWKPWTRFRFTNVVQSLTLRFVILVSPCAITPLQGKQLTEAELRTAVKDVLSEKYTKQGSNTPLLNVNVISAAEAAQRAQVNRIIRIGTNYLGYYDTWMTPADYRAMSNVPDAPAWNRAWPSAEQAAQIDLKFGQLFLPNTGRTPKQTDTWSQFSPAKARKAASKRKGAEPQRSVMGNVTASDLAELLWLEPPRGRGEGQQHAEWLHRSGFALGGLGHVSKGPDYDSSQVPGNLVFGTSECNTHMIRAESEITRLLKWAGEQHAAAAKRTPRQAGPVNKQKLKDIDRSTLIAELFTAIQTKGSVDFLDEHGVRSRKTIDPFVEQQQYFWLAPALWYRFAFHYGDDTKYTDVSFNTFSRYCPTLFEIYLDEKLFKTVFELRGEPFWEDDYQLGSESTPVMGLMANTLDIPMQRAFLNPTEQELRDGDEDRANAEAEFLAALSGQVPPGMTFDENGNFHLGDKDFNSPNVPQHATWLQTSPDIVEEFGTDGWVQLEGSLVLPSTECVQETRSLSTADFSAATLNFGEIDMLTFSAVKTKGPGLESSFEALEGATFAPVMNTNTSAGILASKANVPPGFVLTRPIQLFSTDIIFEFYTYQGSPPEHLRGASAPLKYELGILRNDLRLSSLIPEAKDTLFDGIALSNVCITHQSAVFDQTKAAGWYIEADLRIEKSTGALYDVLTSVLGINEPPIVHLLTFLGEGHSWTAPLLLHSFALEGTLPNINIKLGERLRLTQIGVRLMGIRTYKALGSKSTIEYGFGLFGSMELVVPKSPAPLELDFQIQEMWGNLSFRGSVKGDIWSNVLGLKDLTLTSVYFGCRMNLSRPLKDFDFEVGAVFQTKVITVELRGSYASSGAFELAAAVGRLKWSDIADLYQEIIGDPLSAPDMDIELGDASITISNKGLALAVHDLRIGEYAAVSVELTITSSGISINGAVKNVKFGEFMLEEAPLRMMLARSGSKESNSMVISGRVTWRTFKVAAAVHLYRSKKGDPGTSGSGKTAWALVGSISQDGNMSLSNLVPALSDTPWIGNIVLKKALLVVASANDFALADSHGLSGVQVKEGVQVLAILDRISPIDVLSNQANDSLILQAGLSSKTLSLEILIPHLSNLEIGEGASIQNGRLGIVLSKEGPTLILGGTLKVLVSGQTDPLLFSLTLGLSPTKISGTGIMKGTWRNPFGLLEKLELGPVLMLNVGINPVTFPATLTPSELGFAVEMKVGETEIKMHCNFSQNPSRQLLWAKFDNMKLKDVISLFADIPPGSCDFIYFKTVEIYACPVGMTIDSLNYPRGFSFSADITMFGIRGNAMVNVSSSSVKIEGGIDNFKLGKLSVSGLKGPRAIVDIEISSQKQHALIDGAIRFGDDFVAELHLKFDGLPRPYFKIHFYLNFEGAMTFLVDGELIGPVISLNKLEDLDFSLSGEFRQQLREYIKEQLLVLFKTAENSQEDNTVVAAQTRNLDQIGRELVRKAEDYDRCRQVLQSYGLELAQLNRDRLAARDHYEVHLQVEEACQRQAVNTLADNLRQMKMQLERAPLEWDARIRRAEARLEAAEKEADELGQVYRSQAGPMQREIDDLKVSQSQLLDELDTLGRAAYWEIWKKAQIKDRALEYNAITEKIIFREDAYRQWQEAMESPQFRAKFECLDRYRAELSAVCSEGEKDLSILQQTYDALDRQYRNPPTALNAPKASEESYIFWKKAEDKYATFIKEMAASIEYSTRECETYRSLQQKCQELMDSLTLARSALTPIVVRQLSNPMLGPLDGLPVLASQLGLGEVPNLPQLVRQTAASVAQYFLENLCKDFEIIAITFSGQMNNLSRPDGKIVFSAQITLKIKGEVLSPVSLDLDVRNPMGFLADIFEQVKDEVTELYNSVVN